jgi:hypothetical protein
MRQLRKAFLFHKLVTAVMPPPRERQLFAYPLVFARQLR